MTLSVSVRRGEVAEGLQLVEVQAAIIPNSGRQHHGIGVLNRLEFQGLYLSARQAIKDRLQQILASQHVM